MEHSPSPRRLDLAAYPRRAHFELFCGYANPYVGVTANVDISELAAFRSRSGAPFFLSLLYAVSRAANAVPELRQRIEDGGIVEYDWCPTSHTVAKPDLTYAYCTLRADMPFDRFLPRAVAAQDACKQSGDLQEDADARACLFISTLPWLSYTSLSQPTPNPPDSNPRITWGRAFEQDGRPFVPMTLLGHHALIDGRHIARFYEALAEELKALRD